MRALRIVATAIPIHSAGVSTSLAQRRERSDSLYISGGTLKDVQQAAVNIMLTPPMLSTVRRYCDRLNTGKSARTIPLKKSCAAICIDSMSASSRTRSLVACANRPNKPFATVMALAKSEISSLKSLLINASIPAAMIAKLDDEFSTFDAVQ